MIKILWKIYLILRWNKKTFPHFNWNKQLQKVCEESIEFVDESLFKDGEKALEEGADVIISSIGALRYPEIWELIDEKMKENRIRVFNENGHHTGGDDARDRAA